MSGESPALARTWRVGGYTVELTASRTGHVVVEWLPHMPPRLSRHELRQYRRGRDAAMARLSRELGIGIITVEV